MSETPEFSGDIKVASQIVDYLSSGLYESPAACLKELVNNSYDADASLVEVFVKPDADRIMIHDDGHGMNKAEFKKHFSVISESHKRDESDRTESGRLKIGKIGIGFIAANEICDEMQIISTKRGSSELLDVTIHFDVMRQSTTDRRAPDAQVKKADYDGTTGETDLDSHFTLVVLDRIRGGAKSIFAGTGSSGYGSGDVSLYGLKPETVANRLRDPKLGSWADLDPYSKNALKVALNVPVRYHDDWLPPSEGVAELDFSVLFDGTELRKPVVFRPEGKCLVRSFALDGKHLRARGYFYAQQSVIKPQELHGVLLRIRNAAVGEYDPTFLGFSPTRGPLFQSWISGEIMASEELEDAMNIDRRTLHVAHPAYVELQRAVHEHVAELISTVRSDIYVARREERSDERVKAIEHGIAQVAERGVAQSAPTAAAAMAKAWAKAGDSKPRRKALLRKLSVDEVYALVVEAATDVLPPEQLEKLLARLTERLQR